MGLPVKRGTELLVKFAELQHALALPKWGVKGVLQSLWDFTAENALDGDLTKFTSRQIALGIGWTDDPDALIDALVESRWLDKETEGVRIHDWLDHCEDWIIKRLKRRSAQLENGGRRQIVADNGGQRRTTAKNASLPVPGPDPVPGNKRSRSPDGDQASGAFDGPRPSGWSQRLEDTFNEFWKHYPRREAKGEARKAWAKLKPYPHLEVIHESLRKENWPENWRRDNKKFIPHPATWLNATGWESESPKRNGRREFTAEELESAFDA